MKKFLKYAIIITLFPVIYMTGCKQDKPEPPVGQPAFTALKSYMTANLLDLPDILNVLPIIAAEPISEGGIVDTDNGCTIPGYHVFDIRPGDVFNAGHINGAINVPLPDVVNRAANYPGKPILVVCVTGQTAGHAVMALRLSGYNDAKVLKWGMSGWNPDFQGPWQSNISDTAVGNANWVTTAAPAPSSYADPTWTSSFTDGGDILAERVDFMLNNGFKAVGPVDVLNSPGNYQIVNFWENADYIAFGHYTGAYQIKPISLANNVTNAFDCSKESAVYCFTGQNSSLATAWLNILGYNAVSIKFGVNALNYSGLEAAGKPVWKGPKDYEYVTSK